MPFIISHKAFYIPHWSVIVTSNYPGILIMLFQWLLYRCVQILLRPFECKLYWTRSTGIL